MLSISSNKPYCLNEKEIATRKTVDNKGEIITFMKYELVEKNNFASFFTKALK